MCRLCRLTPLPARHLREPSEAQGLARESPLEQQSKCRGCHCVVGLAPALLRARNLGRPCPPPPGFLSFHREASLLRASHGEGVGFVL